MEKEKRLGGEEEIRLAWKVPLHDSDLTFRLIVANS